MREDERARLLGLPPGTEYLRGPEMNRKFFVPAIMAAALLTAGGLPTAAAPATSTTVCSLRLGSVDATGGEVFQQVAATRPPTISSDGPTLPVFAAGQVRLSSSLVVKPGPVGPAVDSYVIIGSGMYHSTYRTGFDGRLDPKHPPVLTRIGGGWGTFTAFERSIRAGYTTYYGLRNDGMLFRWTSGADGVWHRAGSVPGFAGFKTMALISKTRTYDTFLMNTRAGALYTFHIPVGSPMHGLVKMVRERTWQGFESLVAEKCGVYGTLLLGIDQDTHAGYLYPVGHANGFATVIQQIGKVPVPLTDDVYFRVVPSPAVDVLNGE